ncbi:MAG: apolipoprotein N-acyltransferase [Oscillospiraceae bacterium]
MKKFSLIFCLISAVLSGISFTSETFWWLEFISLIPLIIAIFSTNSAKKTFLYTLVFSIIYHFITIIWLYSLDYSLPFGKNNFLILTLGIVLIGTIGGVLQGFSVCLFQKIRLGKFGDAFKLALLWCFGEWLRGVFPIFPFPWARFGVQSVNSLAFSQSASLFGSLFLTFLVLTINVCLAMLVLNLKTMKLAKMCGFATLFILFGNVLFGIFRQNIEIPRSSFEVCLIQGNLGSANKWQLSSEETTKIYLNLIEKHTTSNTKMILLPETALAFTLEEKPLEIEKFKELSNKINAEIVTGIIHKEKHNNLVKKYNSIIAISPNGKISEPYCKEILVPFGEFLPFEETLKKFTDKLDDFTSFSSKSNEQVLDGKIGKIGGGICYESVFPQIIRNSVLNGAEILVIPSNDSWFGNSSAIYQHYLHSILRAIENNRYLLRCSSTAVTCVISPFGEVISQAEKFIESGITANVSAISDKSLYNILGDLPALVGFFCVIFGIIKHLISLQELRGNHLTAVNRLDN